MSLFGNKIVDAMRNKGKTLEGEMSFFEHLEALRWHLIRSALAIVFFAIFAFAYYDTIFDGLIMAPTNESVWTYRMMCDFGHWLHGVISWFKAEDFCVKTVQVHLINTELSG